MFQVLRIRAKGPAPQEQRDRRVGWAGGHEGSNRGGGAGWHGRGQWADPIGPRTLWLSLWVGGAGREHSEQGKDIVRVHRKRIAPADVRRQPRRRGLVRRMAARAERPVRGNCNNPGQEGWGEETGTAAAQAGRGRQILDAS